MLNTVLRRQFHANVVAIKVRGFSDAPKGIHPTAASWPRLGVGALQV